MFVRVAVESAGSETGAGDPPNGGLERALRRLGLPDRTADDQRRDEPGRAAEVHPHRPARRGFYERGNGLAGRATGWRRRACSNCTTASASRKTTSTTPPTFTDAQPAQQLNRHAHEIFHGSFHPAAGAGDGRQPAHSDRGLAGHPIAQRPPISAQRKCHHHGDHRLCRRQRRTWCAASSPSRSSAPSPRRTALITWSRPASWASPPSRSICGSITIPKRRSPKSVPRWTRCATICRPRRKFPRSPSPPPTRSSPRPI